MMYVCWLSVCDRTNLKPHSLLASVNSCVCKSGLYGFSCGFSEKLCFICLNSLSNSGVHLPSKWLFSFVIYHRCFVCIVMVGYQLCRTFTIPSNEWTCVFVVGGSNLRIVSILSWSALIVMVLSLCLCRWNPP